jgi:uncharacterized protein YccT (UPF0319 family)
VAIAPSVIVTDTGGNPIAGVGVTFAVASGDGSLAASGDATTNDAGIATSPAWTLGTTAGTNTLTATSTGLTNSPITFTATGTAGAATQLTITTQPSATAASGAAFAQQPAIQLRDGSGNAVEQIGVIVTAAIASGDGTLGGTLTATTDVAGLATFTDLSITGLAGERTLSFTSGTLTAATSSAIDITAGAATQLTITTQPSATAASGTAFAQQPAIQLRDGGGNAVAQADVVVTAAIASGDGTLGGTVESTTDAAGLATFADLSITGLVGERTLSFTSGTLTAATSSAIDITAGTATQLTIPTQPSATAASGAAFAQQPAIQLRDGGGNSVAQADVVVTAAIASGDGTLGGTVEATTDAAGLATFTDLSITGLVGARTLSFTGGTLTAATSSAIDITAGAATQVAINTGNDQIATAGTAVAVAPSVIVTDTGGNPIAGVSVTFAVASGGGSLATTDPVVTDAAGIAVSPTWTLGLVAGANTLTATAAGLTGSPVTFTATGT